MNTIEIAGFVTGIVGVYLTIKQHPFCWPISAINVLIYALIFWNEKLYADAGLQCVYLIVCIYGWYIWTKGAKDYKPESSLLKVSKTPLWELSFSFFVMMIASVSLGFTLALYSDASFPLADSSLTGISLWAQYLQTKKRIENWYIWIFVDSLYIGLFAVKGLYPTAFLYVLYTTLAIHGLINWKRIYEPPPNTFLSNEEA